MNTQARLGGARTRPTTDTWRAAATAHQSIVSQDCYRVTDQTTRLTQVRSGDRPQLHHETVTRNPKPGHKTDPGKARDQGTYLNFVMD